MRAEETMSAADQPKFEKHVKQLEQSVAAIYLMLKKNPWLTRESKAPTFIRGRVEGALKLTRWRIAGSAPAKEKMLRKNSTLARAWKAKRAATAA